MSLAPPLKVLPSAEFAGAQAAGMTGGLWVDNSAILRSQALATEVDDAS
jgi:hypothetical protein